MCLGMPCLASWRARVWRIRVAVTTIVWLVRGLIGCFGRGDRWDVVIWHGEGDCPAGCIDNYYYYYSAWRNGRVEKAGEFSRVLNRASNSYVERGTPLWGST